MTEEPRDKHTLRLKLNTEVQRDNASVAIGRVRCRRMKNRTKATGSSTNSFSQYANHSGPSRLPVKDFNGCFGANGSHTFITTDLSANGSNTFITTDVRANGSNAFITTDVRATGLQSFRAAIFGFMGTRMMVETLKQLRWLSVGTKRFVTPSPVPL